MPLGDDGAGEGVPMKVEVVAMAMGQGWSTPGADPDDGGPCLNRSHDGPEPQAVEGVYRSSFDPPSRGLSGSTEYRSSFDPPSRGLSGSTAYRSSFDPPSRGLSGSTAYRSSFDPPSRGLSGSTEYRCDHAELSCSALTNEESFYPMYSLADVSRSSDLNADFRARSQSSCLQGGPRPAPHRAELGPPGALELEWPQRARAPPPGTHDEVGHGMDQQQFNQHVDSYTPEVLERVALRIQEAAAQERLKRQAKEAMNQVAWKRQEDAMNATKRLYEEPSQGHPNPMAAGQWPPYPQPWPDPSMMGMPYSMPPWHPLYMMQPWPPMPAEQDQHPRRSRRGGSDAHAWRRPSDASHSEGGYAMDGNEGDGPDEVPTDQKTTIMLRNIPNNYTRDDVENLLNEHNFKGKYDFLYLPYDFNKRAGLGYAFINFVTHEYASLAKEAFDSYEQWSVASKKKASVCWGNRFQGREANIKRYKDSPVMHPQVNDLYKPMCYDEQGNKVSDPLKPEKQPRRPRWKHGPNVSEANFMPGFAQASDLGLVDPSASCLRPDMG